MSLDAQVLAALQAGDVITPAVAWERWRILALHSAIARLRKTHPIHCTMRRENGRTFGSYTLTNERR